MLPVDVVRELAALLPIRGMKRVPDRVRDEDGASFLQGLGVSPELETSRRKEDHRGVPPPRRGQGRGLVVGAVREAHVEAHEERF